MSKRLLIPLLLIFAATAAYSADFTGRYATNWGIIELKQNGKKVTGTYKVPAPGEIEGSMENDTLVYKWWQSDGVWGQGRFKLLDKGQKIHGTWGFGVSSDNGGIWEGERN